MKKIIVANVILFIFLILIGSNVLAATSLNASVTSSLQEAKGGQEVIVTLRFDTFQEVKKGINAYQATFEYDKEVFEQVKEDDIKALNNWEKLKYNQETGELVAIKRAGTKAEEDIVQIKLKVKEDAKPQETEVGINDIVTSEGKEDLFIQDAIVKINIIKEQTEQPDNPGTDIEQGELFFKSTYKTEKEDTNIYLYKINPKTTLNNFIANCQTNGDISIYKKDGTLLGNNEFVGTEMILKVRKGQEEISMTIAVIGDTDGNGQVTPTDLSDAIHEALNGNILNKVQILATDINEDRKITPTDLAEMIKLTLKL